MNQSTAKKSAGELKIKDDSRNKEDFVHPGPGWLPGKYGYAAAGFFGLLGIVQVVISLLKSGLESKVWYLSWSQHQSMPNTDWHSLLKAAESMDPHFSLWNFVVESIGLFSLLCLSASMLILAAVFLMHRVKSTYSRNSLILNESKETVSKKTESPVQSNVCSETKMLKEELRQYALNQEFMENQIHQLKSTLAAALLESELLEQTDADACRLLKELIQHSADISCSMIERKNNPSAELRMRFREVSLRSLLQSVKQRLIPLARSRKAAIKVLTPDLTLLADPFWLEETLETLLSNGLRYSKTGSEAFVEAFQKEDDLVIKIINENNENVSTLEKDIFLRYSSWNPADQHYGIGLHMARQVIARHFGTIEMLAGPNQTEFRICLPLLERSRMDQIRDYLAL